MRLIVTTKSVLIPPVAARLLVFTVMLELLQDYRRSGEESGEKRPK